MDFLVGSYGDDQRATVYWLHADPHNFVISQKAQWSGLTNPSFLSMVTPNTLMAVSETQPGMVATAQFSPSKTPRSDLGWNQIPSLGNDPCHLALSPDGTTVVVSNYSGPGVSLFTLDRGQLRSQWLLDTSSDHKLKSDGQNLDRQEGCHPHSAAFNSDGRFLAVSDLGNDAVYIYSLPQGAEPSLTMTIRLPAGSGPRMSLWHEIDGELRLTVLGELNSTLQCYGIDLSSAQAQLRWRTSTHPIPGHSGLAGHLAMVGPQIWVSNRGDDTIVALSPHDGAVEAWLPCGSFPRHFAFIGTEPSIDSESEMDQRTMTWARPLVVACQLANRIELYSWSKRKAVFEIPGPSVVVPLN